LEDPELLARIRAARPARARAGGPSLRVIANDDTAALEVTRLLVPESTRMTFADVGGLDHVKGMIHKRIILPFAKPSLFQRFKKRVGGGILLYGPPGCGKTLLARATAGECSAAFFNVAISDVLDMYIGESERKLNALFEKARSSAPAVLFFDELEALAGKRQYTREATSSKLVSQFLSEMDGFTRNNHGVLIMGATNVPWAIDPAFQRPGRFDRVLFIPPPDRTARRSILERLLDKRPSAKLDLDFVAEKTPGFSGADLENIVELASDAATEVSLEQGKEVPIEQAHLVRALGEARPTTGEWLTTARNYARYANQGGLYDDVLQFLDKHAKA
jgi:SpoVK/Ycf46/Vps4 family AAA+-type ATPase